MLCQRFTPPLIDATDFLRRCFLMPFRADAAPAFVREARHDATLMPFRRLPCDYLMPR